MLIRHIVCRFLEQRGLRVESATNGAEALEKLNTFHPDVIITDIEMPQMDGRELIQTLKARPETANIPIVVVARKRYAPEEGGLPEADYIIIKSSDITGQLEEALKMVMGTAAGSTGGKFF